MASSSHPIDKEAASSLKCRSVTSSRMPPPNEGPFESWGRTTAHNVEFKFTWTIDNFASRTEQPGEFLESPIFSSGSNNNELKWTLRAYPRGPTWFVKYFSIYLHLVSSSYKDTEFPVQYTVIIFNDDPDKDVIMSICAKFASGSDDPDSDDCDVMKLDDLLDEAKGFLPDGNLTVLCQGVATVDTETVGLSE